MMYRPWVVCVRLGRLALPCSVGFVRLHGSAGSPKAFPGVCSFGKALPFFNLSTCKPKERKQSDRRAVVVNLPASSEGLNYSGLQPVQVYLDYTSRGKRMVTLWGSRRVL